MYVVYWFNPDDEYATAVVDADYVEWMQCYGHFIRSVFLIPDIMRPEEDDNTDAYKRREFLESINRR